MDRKGTSPCHTVVSQLNGGQLGGCYLRCERVIRPDTHRVGVRIQGDVDVQIEHKSWPVAINKFWDAVIQQRRKVAIQSQLGLTSNALLLFCFLSVKQINSSLWAIDKMALTTHKVLWILVIIWKHLVAKCLVLQLNAYECIYEQNRLSQWTAGHKKTVALIRPPALLFYSNLSSSRRRKMCKVVHCKLWLMNLRGEAETRNQQVSIWKTTPPSGAMCRASHGLPKTKMEPGVRGQGRDRLTWRADTWAKRSCELCSAGHLLVRLWLRRVSSWPLLSSGCTWLIQNTYNSASGCVITGVPEIQHKKSRDSKSNKQSTNIWS